MDVKVCGVKKVWPCLLLAAAGVPVSAQAEEIVVFDQTFEATSANTTNSEYRAMPASGVPANWRTPINFANGKVTARAEVLSKPSAAPTLLNICFRNPSSYACMMYSPAYTATGSFEYEHELPEWWQYAMVDWAMGVSQVMLVIKDQDEKMVQGDADFYPYRMKLTITVESPEGAPAAGSGGRGGSGGAGMSGAGGRGGSGGAVAAGRGGGGAMAGSPPATGGAGAAGTIAMDAGATEPDPDPVPAEPDAAAGVADAWPGFQEDPDEPAQLPPQPVGPEPNKRAPPPGGIEGNCAAGGPGASDVTAGWALALAAACLARRRRRARDR